jgi:hypothetical protein
LSINHTTRQGKPQTTQHPDTHQAQHLGDLARADVRWPVYKETNTAGTSAKGRVHFVSGARHRTSGWIFLEWSEQAIYDRFAEFSPAELWKLLESLA